MHMQFWYAKIALIRIKGELCPIRAEVKKIQIIFIKGELLP